MVEYRDEFIKGSEPEFSQHEYALDATGELLGLTDARMANIVGIPLVAMTADGQVLFVRQTARNSVLPQCFAASSSGSLDWADAKCVRQRADAVGQSVVLLDVLFEGHAARTAGGISGATR